jgi:hypothetical protein
VEWLLLTSLPVANAEQARQVIQYYCTRWMIEILFSTLKQGCRVEERRFAHLDRVLPCVAVFLIEAWRTLYVCRLGRSVPDISCEAVVEPSKWKAVYRVVRRETPPHQRPPLAEMVRLVAQLGGCVNRSRKDPPDTKPYGSDCNACGASPCAGTSSVPRQNHNSNLCRTTRAYAHGLIPLPLCG